ncbi:MAG TPA: hypothetical protein EYP57_04340 [Thermodesulfobacteriaceae bacterium]|nr:hypothetical protein [Thermodesulfobacteriaceae bacterium]
MAKTKKKQKKIQFQMGWGGLMALTVSTVCVLLWIFIFGFWTGQKLISRKTPPAQESVLTAKVSPEVKILTNPALDSQKTEELSERPGKDIRPGGSADRKISEAQAEKKPAEARKKTSTQEKKPAAAEKTRATPRKTASKAEKQATKPGGKTRYFALQIASYREKNRADREAARWKKKGYTTMVKKAYLGKQKGTWYRVYLGHMKSEREAKRLARRLASNQGIKSYVVSLRD